MTSGAGAGRNGGIDVVRCDERWPIVNQRIISSRETTVTDRAGINRRFYASERALDTQTRATPIVRCRPRPRCRRRAKRRLYFSGPCHNLPSKLS